MSLRTCQFRLTGDSTVTTLPNIPEGGSGFSAIQNVTLTRVVAAGSEAQLDPITATIAGASNGVTPDCQQQLSGRRTGAWCELPGWREVPGTIGSSG